MKILDLDLKAFGLFSGKQLKLNDPQATLHVIYGPNEAGKSTILRAIRCWLYGIPAQTTDDFRHDKSDLRIGGRLLTGSGQEITFVRRKGNRNTILDGDGEKVLSDGLLDPCLQEVGKELFETLFGFDHHEMVKGSQEILLGRGNVGQSIFVAATGLVRLRSVLNDLEEECGKLFKGQASTPEINKLLGLLKEARSKLRESELSSSEWADIEQKRDEFWRREQELTSRVSDLQILVARLGRIQLAHPLIVRRTSALQRLEGVKNAVRLPGDFATRRSQAESSYRDTRQTKEQAERELEHINHALAELVIPEDLLKNEKTIESLVQNRLADYTKSVLHDLPDLSLQVRQLDEEVDRLLADLGGLTREQARDMGPNRPERDRIRRLGQEKPKLDSKFNAAQREINRCTREDSQRQQDLSAIGEAKDGTALRQVLDAARQDGKLERMLREAREKVIALEREATQDSGRLRPWQGAVSDIETLVVPAKETVERFVDEFEGLERKRTALEDELREDREKLERATRELQVLRLSGHTPTEQNLIDARHRREKGWKLLKRQWIGSEEIGTEARMYDPDLALPEAYESSVEDSDGIADRLRREADRVIQLANKSIEDEECRKTINRLEEEIKSNSACHDAAEKRWAEHWHASGFAPLSPREMEAWLQREESLLSKLEDLRAQRSEADRLEQIIKEHRIQIQTVLSGLGEKIGSGEALADLIRKAEAVSEGLSEQAQKRQALGQVIRQVQAECVAAQMEEADASRGLEEWKLNWKKAVDGLKLQVGSSPEDAATVMDGLESVLSKMDSVLEKRRRMESIEKNGKNFAEQVGALAKTLAPELIQESSDKALMALAERVKQARLKATQREQNERQRERWDKTLEDAQAEMAAAQSTLRELCVLVKCEQSEQLESAEERSRLRVGLEEELDQHEARLTELAAGQPLAELIAACQETSVDEIGGKRGTADQEVKSLESERTAVNQQIGSLTNQLETLRQGGSATEAAELVETLLAEIRQKSELYAQRRLAVALLKREIESYREKNQGPILKAASEIFSRLTSGSFSGIVTDVGANDEPVLVGVRPHDERVFVDGLSGGSRDQLYLALRLAALSHYLESHEAMPFIVDDILIEFDDDRARIALGELQKLSSKTQVLVFTHHRRLVELANELSGSGITCHVLSADAVDASSTEAQKAQLALVQSQVDDVRIPKRRKRLS